MGSLRVRQFPSGSWYIRKVGQKWHIDLPECNRQQLLASGVPAAQVDVSPICTYQHPETYFSARRLSINSGRIFTGILMG